MVRRVLEVLDLQLVADRRHVPDVWPDGGRPRAARRCRVARPPRAGRREGQGAVALQTDGGGARDLPRLALRPADRADRVGHLENTSRNSTMPLSCVVTPSMLG